MIDDQASALRIASQARQRDNPATAGRLRCLAVGSGKGGVGKTMVSVNVGYCLARLGFRVLIVDADLGLANVDLQIGITPGFTLQDVLFGKCSMNQAVTRIVNGPDVLAAASGAPEMADLGNARRQMFAEELVRFAARYDFLIIDVGAGIGRGVTDFLSAAPEVLVVVANEPTSIMDAYALIKTMIKSPSPPFMAAVINQVRSTEEGHLLATRINSITKRFLGIELPVAGIIPYDRAISDSIRARTPVVLHAPQSLPVLALQDMAQELTSGRHRQRAAARSQTAVLEQLLTLGS